ncbi:MAG: alanine/glycine:cation symporter family protein [Marinilabiliaceae bacterium]|jgi:AGCS family alanine or glycine:cation symporter|nr:alanine/glycine:cation symporter family protein [Marinilabiliaceae bacterium]
MFIAPGYQPTGISDKIDSAFEPVVIFLEKVFFWDPVKAMGFDIGAQVPIVVLWLLFGGVYFTFRMRFINVRAFRHAFKVILGRYDKPGTEGEVSHFQALTTALSATVGLGNITGVAIAVTVGGPGATFWMILAGFFGMSMKFTECTLGLKYRHIDARGRVSGGPMYYLSRALKKRRLGALGKVLAVFSAVMMVLASFGGSNMLQSNQSFVQLATVMPFFEGHGFWFGIGLSALIALVVLGGIKSIARVTSRLVPFMAALYICAALVIIFMNFSRIDDVMVIIFKSAFSPVAVKGGIIGVIITGFRRGAFSNEAGVGSAAVAHAAARTDEPVKEGIVAMLEPFIDTVIICTMTSLVIIFTGFHEIGAGLEGTELTSAAFESVFPWFPYILVIAILCFAFSTMISWSYYGLKGFNYLVGDSINKITGKSFVSLYIYYAIFLFFTVVGASSSLTNVIAFSDMMVLTMAFPNILGLLILTPEVIADLKSYMLRLKRGEIKQYN